MKESITTHRWYGMQRLRLLGLLLLAVLVLSGCRRGGSSQTTEILNSYLPKDWVGLTDNSTVRGFQKITLDGDEYSEWLYFFHYDNQGDALGPVGGIIYDAQQTVDPLQPAAYFVPYRLLPDWRDGKGQGYLGETTVTWAAKRLDASIEEGSADELAVLGYSVGGVPTRLSLFRWLDVDRGYAVAHFDGNAGVQITPSDLASPGLITEVLTLDKLNDRSRLCKLVKHTRQGDGLSFASAPAGIVFCPAAADLVLRVPDNPTHPEAVVMAWLLGGQNSVLALPGQNDALKAALKGEMLQVVTVTYPGVATLDATGAYVSRQEVQTLLATNNGTQVVQWNLVELRPTIEERTSRWRIESAQIIE